MDNASVHAAPAAPSPHLRATQVGWLVAYGALVVTAVAAVPSAIRLNTRLNALHLPDGRWTLGQLRDTLAEVGTPEQVFALIPVVSSITIGVVFLLVAGVMVARRPGDRAVLTISSLLAVAGWGISGAPLTFETLYPAAQPALRMLGITAFTCLFLLLYVFPDGRFRPRWTRWPALVFLLAAPLSVLGGVFDPATWPALLRTPWDVVSVGIPLYSQVHRYRRSRSDPVQRQQIKWVVLSVVALLVGSVPLIALPLLMPELTEPGTTAALWYHMISSSGLAVLILLVPVAIGVATLRLRLWDVDPILTRTLVYGSLTVVVGGLFTAVLGLLGWLFRAPGSLVFSLLSAGLVAVAFEPLRRRTQRAVNRMVYGERDDPYALLSRLGERVETSLAPDSVLTSVVRTVREAFRLPYALIELVGRDGERLRTVSEPPDAPVATGVPADGSGALRVALRFRGDVVGWLVVPPRGPDETFGVRDRRLLDELARQAGAAVYAVRATMELQHAHERLVTAGQEERRRLRRELHDVLGPTLAAMSMDLEVASALVPTDPLRATALMADVRSSLQTTIGQVRRLAYALYPPILDQLGLPAALREQAAHQLEMHDVAVRLDLPQELGTLPAATEVAAYHIATEAMANVRRHSGARRCLLRLVVDDGWLGLEIADDGHGLPRSARRGVGMTSMRERAVELGGSCEVEAASPSGTRVLARLPLRDLPARA